ncbi:MAG: histidinol dehydrogenase [Treponema sp.]|jgi:histidinol dehydrogenase|nr:histidinol dehydrogenase [Treponema sp.]
MRIIQDNEFDAYWKNVSAHENDLKTEETVRDIIEDVRKNGDAAVKKYASKFDKSSPGEMEVPVTEAKRALDELRKNDPALTEAMELAADHIWRFSKKQREQFADFEYEMESGLVTGQRVIPAEKAAIYIPGGRFPLFSSVLMCMIPAFCAGVEEVMLSSPPAENGIPDKKILAAAAIAADVCGIKESALRIFAIGGAQAIAALALGTESVPRADIIAGPGSKYVAAAKKLLFGETGIDFIAGPTDVLIITGRDIAAAELAASDMIAQAEHDPDARARAIVPSKEYADIVSAAVEKHLVTLSNEKTARASLDAGGLIIVCESQKEAIRISNIIAPEHLELQTEDADSWIPNLKNYGSLFIGKLSAEVLGDYSAGINHTLPTSASARFTGGLGVRHFLKTVTTLRCAQGEGFEKARTAAEILGRAEGLEGHAQSARIRREWNQGALRHTANSRTFD